MEKIGNGIYDKRIDSWNLLFELNLQEYFDLSKDIMGKNEFQRSRVPSSKTIYSLLKEDLKHGCVMPPIVLALNSTLDDAQNAEKELIEKKDNLIILDGLQRTFTIRDLINDLNKEGDENAKKILSSVKIRIEVYWGINRTNVLYRMLTLNTGHTPMSTRHQIEIVYSDLIKQPPEGIKILKDTDTETVKGLGTYLFKDVIDGFISYLEGDYLPIDRTDILDTVKELENFFGKNQKDKDLFLSFIKTYDSMVRKIDDVSGHWEYGEDESIGNPFGRNIPHLFSKAQSLAGFGAAIYKLMRYGDLSSIDDLQSRIERIDSNGLGEALDLLNEHMNSIRGRAKKIGNDQRCFFYFIYRNLFSSDDKKQGNLYESISEAYKSYERETM